MYIWALLIVLLHKTFMAVSLWQVFKDKQINPYFTLIPFYGEWLWIKILGKGISYFIFFLFPFINFFIVWLLYIDTASAYKKNTILDCAGAVLLPFIYFPFLQRKQKLGFVCPKELPPVKKSPFREWFDAIVFGLVAALLIHAFYFKGYVIPSSSMEKSLLVGDCLFVSKIHYGARLPNTPLCFPFVHHTLPFSSDKLSFSTAIQLPYFRFPGFSEIKHNDVIVFNYPEGDTVSTVYQSNLSYSSLVRQVGRERVWNDKRTFGKIVSRPVDKRENFVKRCIALAGDTLLIKNGQVFINGEIGTDPENIEFNYSISAPHSVGKNQWRKMGVSYDDLAYMGYTENQSLPLCNTSLKKLSEANIKAEKLVDPQGKADASLFPFVPETYPWNVDNYGPIYIPKQGDTLPLNLENLPLYHRIIEIYEANRIDIKDQKIFINGIESTTYVFKMNYYWAMGDNRHNSADSRYWGFVPEDHILGKAFFVWFSWDKDGSNLFDKIRFKKMFRVIK